MARFLARVELHGAKHGDQTYEHLHNEMTLVGFDRTIKIGKKVFHLPPAEYTCTEEDSVTAESVYDKAEVAALQALAKSKLKSVPAIVVAKMDGGLFVGGLDEIE